MTVPHDPELFATLEVDGKCAGQLFGGREDLLTSIEKMRRDNRSVTILRVVTRESAPEQISVVQLEAELDGRQQH